MSDDPFDDLEGQLRRAVRSFSKPRAGRVRRGRKRTMLLAMAAVLGLSAAALAATRITSGQSLETQGRELALRAVRETAGTPACAEGTHAGPTLSNGAPLKEITDLLPALNTPVSSGERRNALAFLPRWGNGGPVLARTLRIVSLGNGIRLLVYVEEGTGIAAVSDPAGCGRERVASVMSLAKGRPAAVLRWARWRLAQMPDTIPGSQSLSLLVHAPGQPGNGGGSEPLHPGRALRPGLRLVAGMRGGGRLFVGVARRRTAEVIVKTDPARMRGNPRRAEVRQGFYGVILPKGVGPFRLLEEDARGVTVASVNLRQ